MSNEVVNETRGLARRNMVWSPEQYQQAAVIAQLAEQELLSRLKWMKLNPKSVLDLGCGMGTSSQQLSARYPKSTVIALDLSMDMLVKGNKTQSDVSLVCGGAQALPIASHTIDLIFMNMLLPWCDDIALVLSECARVLRADGLVIFSGLGLDTLKEQPGILGLANTPNLLDMHDLGDAVVQAGLIEPVIEVQHQVVRYQHQSTLQFDMVASGMMVESQVAGLEWISDDENKLPITYEMVYGHAFARQVELALPSENGVSYMPLTSLRAQLRSDRN